MPKFKIIGITGATGSGKSTLTEYLVQKNFFVIDADKIARQIVQKGSICLQCITAVFGRDILYADGTLNRKVLARKAFSEKSETEKLNRITHPFIIAETLQRIDNIRQQNTSSVIILDAPLLFESKMDILCDYTISVLCNKDIRLQRIMKRDNLSQNEALLRMNAQPEDIFYRSRSDFIIDGSKPLSEIYADTDSIIRTITER